MCANNMILELELRDALDTGQEAVALAVSVGQKRAELIAHHVCMIALLELGRPKRLGRIPTGIASSFASWKLCGSSRGTSLFSPKSKSNAATRTSLGRWSKRGWRWRARRPWDIGAPRCSPTTPGSRKMPPRAPHTLPKPRSFLLARLWPIIIYSRVAL